VTLQAEIIQIADAVVSYLNAGSFTPALNAVRSYLPTIELGDVATLRVTVIPRESDDVPETRTQRELTYKLDVGVQKKLSSFDEIDGLMLLVESIIDSLWASRQLPAMPQAMLRAIEHTTMYSADHLDQLRQFTSVFTVTYRVVR